MVKLHPLETLIAAFSFAACTHLSLPSQPASFTKQNNPCQKTYFTRPLINHFDYRLCPGARPKVLFLEGLYLGAYRVECRQEGKLEYTFVQGNFRSAEHREEINSLLGKIDYDQDGIISEKEVNTTNKFVDQELKRLCGKK